MWDAIVIVSQAEIPFRFEIAGAGQNIRGFFFEGEKKIGSTSGRFANGEVTFDYEFLNSTLTAKLEDGELRGTYHYNRKNGRVYPFRARRFVPGSPEQGKVPQVAGNWEMKPLDVDPQTAAKDPSATLSWNLYLRQSGREVTGSILRVDGDTGNLSGRWRGDKLVLSHFAGERPVLFEGRWQPDGTLDVTMYGKYKYLAVRSSEARAKGIPEPPDPSRFTSVKDPSKPFHFRFADINGKEVSDSDSRFKGKVVLLSIGGTWCPNCREETPLLLDLYKEFHAQGLEIVGLNFEATGDRVEDKPRIASFIKEFGIPYPILYAGGTSDLHEKLPQLVNFGAYPTSVYLGRDGLVKSVHAGFASDATGEAHTELQREVRILIQRLIAEK
jgi:thiol-disulfide isomerase/thioredoxin